MQRHLRQRCCYDALSSSLSLSLSPGMVRFQNAASSKAEVCYDALEGALTGSLCLFFLQKKWFSRMLSLARSLALSLYLILTLLSRSFSLSLSRSRFSSLALALALALSLAVSLIHKRPLACTHFFARYDRETRGSARAAKLGRPHAAIGRGLFGCIPSSCKLCVCVCACPEQRRAERI